MASRMHTPYEGSQYYSSPSPLQVMRSSVEQLPPLRVVALTLISTSAGQRPFQSDCPILRQISVGPRKTRTDVVI